MNNRIFAISLLLFFGFLSQNIYAMEGQQPEETSMEITRELKRKRQVPTKEGEKEERPVEEPAQKKIKGEEIAQAGVPLWEALPVELQQYILSFIPHAASYEKWLELRTVSKQFKGIFDQPEILAAIAERLYTINPVGAYKLQRKAARHKNTLLENALINARKSLGLPPIKREQAPKRGTKPLSFEEGRLLERLTNLRKALANARPDERLEIQEEIQGIKEQLGL